MFGVRRRRGQNNVNPEDSFQAIITVTSIQPFSAATIKTIEAGQTWLRMLGIIIYEDGTGIRRISSYARVYDRRLRRFVKVPDDLRT